jgi:hypothetical protein
MFKVNEILQMLLVSRADPISFPLMRNGGEEDASGVFKENFASVNFKGL